MNYIFDDNVKNNVDDLVEGYKYDVMFVDQLLIIFGKSKNLIEEIYVKMYFDFEKIEFKLVVVEEKIIIEE